MWSRTVLTTAGSSSARRCARCLVWEFPGAGAVAAAEDDGAAQRGVARGRKMGEAFVDHELIRLGRHRVAVETVVETPKGGRCVQPRRAGRRAYFGMAGRQRRSGAPSGGQGGRLAVVSRETILQARKMSALKRRISTMTTTRKALPDEGCAVAQSQYHPPGSLQDCTAYPRPPARTPRRGRQRKRWPRGWCDIDDLGHHRSVQKVHLRRRINRKIRKLPVPGPKKPS